MTVNYCFPESGGSDNGRHLHPDATTRLGSPPRDEGFCDLHLFHCYEQAPRVVVVHCDPSYGQTVPVVTWLEVHSTADPVGAAAVFLEVLGHAATTSVPVRLYDHDPHGNIHSWTPQRPTALTRERLAALGAGRAER